ncbi:MAG TPA: TylF/MycF family methyltransferase [Acidimicrobiales bacterium]|nr:TylF/MycF family methyltransferase [Acidimicrobiales bacterium]
MSDSAARDDRAAELYLELIKGCLTRELFTDSSRVLAGPSLLQRLTRNRIGGGGHRVEVGGFDPSLRAEGRDWPSEAETMIGRARLDNLERCVTDVVRQGVPGDLIETGVWRGGATILMRAVLAAYGDTTRNVWVADSFQGLPKPDAEHYPQDAGDEHWTMSDDLGIPLEAVQANFAKYGLLDDQVRFLVGWFSDTLPTAPIEKLAVVRLDGDMYESTMDGLRNLYPKLSVGGYLIVDDYGAVPACKEAVEDYRAEHGITDTEHQIDWTGIYWQRSS